MKEPISRLNPRHYPISQIEVTWTARTAEDQAKTRFKTKTSSVSATVLDVSVTGMLVDLPLDQKTKPGDIVVLSWDNYHAVGRVAHTARRSQWLVHWWYGEELAHQLVGVEIIEMSPEFAAELNDHGQIAQLAELFVTRGRVAWRGDHRDEPGVRRRAKRPRSDRPARRTVWNGRSGGVTAGNDSVHSNLTPSTPGAEHPVSEGQGGAGAGMR